MKEGIWANEIAPGQQVKGIFLAKDKKLLQGKTGKPYLLMKIMDSSGEVEARVWDRAQEFSSQFQQGDIIWISGESVSYQGTLQIKVYNLRSGGPMKDEHIAEFVPEYAAALEQSQKRLDEIIELLGRIEDEPLRTLVLLFFEDPELKTGWLCASAAKSLHHARFGGLLEHTLSVCKLVEMLRGYYPTLNYDLLMVGAALHDIGKLKELEAPWKPEYTTPGRLLGHVMMGVEMIYEKLSTLPSFPADCAMELKHMMLSHHGYYEYGSPKRPKTLEAIMLHCIDDLDAKFDAFHTLVTAKGENDDPWTPYHHLFERYLYRGGILSGEDPGSDE